VGTSASSPPRPAPAATSSLAAADAAAAAAAAAARDGDTRELASLTRTLVVPHDRIAVLIGKGGATITALRGRHLAHGVTVRLDNQTRIVTASGACEASVSAAVRDVAYVIETRVLPGVQPSAARVQPWRYGVPLRGTVPTAGGRGPAAVTRGARGAAGAPPPQWWSRLATVVLQQRFRASVSFDPDGVLELWADDASRLAEASLEARLLIHAKGYEPRHVGTPMDRAEMQWIGVVPPTAARAQRLWQLAAAAGGYAGLAAAGKAPRDTSVVVAIPRGGGAGVSLVDAIAATGLARWR
jgi:hypothetical protein